MRKSFPLEVPGLKRARVVEAIKSEVRRYLKRERRKDLPEGTDYWAFDCKSGPDQPTAKPTHVAELIGAIDHAAQEKWPSLFLEILARPAARSSSAADSPPSIDPPA